MLGGVLSVRKGAQSGAMGCWGGPGGHLGGPTGARKGAQSGVMGAGGGLRVLG